MITKSAMGAVKANNELRELAAKEKLEIERILAELSADCAERREDIDSDFEMLTRLDLIFAKAKLSYKLDCQAPSLSDRGVLLHRARHPLLARATAVPIDVELGDEFDTLVITGPNTGGKTVTLKTIGLLCLLVEKVADFSVIVANSEFEALVLENSLIKRHQPHYNILLKDDKCYPFIRLDTAAEYPSFSIVHGGGAGGHPRGPRPRQRDDGFRPGQIR